jgi:predicted RNA binding protein YcfA (HicA-like mRNA interferase family)
MRKLFYKAGYELVSGGKGSHWKLVRGNETVIIPNHRELKKGLSMVSVKN